LNAGGQKDPVRIPNNDIFLNHIAGIGCGDQADAEVVPLSNVAVSAQPVRTEPVVAGATRQSYTAAGTTAVSVAHGDVVLEQMTGSADNDHAGQAIGGHGHAGQRDPRAVVHHNPLVPKTLHDSEAANHDILQGVDKDANLIAGLAPAAGGHRVALPGDAVAVQIQCQAGRAKCDAWCAGDCAGHVTDKPAVIRDGQGRADDAVDIRSLGVWGAAKERRNA